MRVRKRKDEVQQTDKKVPTSPPKPEETPPCNLPGSYIDSLQCPADRHTRRDPAQGPWSLTSDHRSKTPYDYHFMPGQAGYRSQRLERYLKDWKICNIVYLIGSRALRSLHEAPCAVWSRGDSPQILPGISRFACSLARADGGVESSRLILCDVLEAYGNTWIA